MNNKNNLDVVIVGGSYAGLSAAMALGRAIKNVMIIDSGKPCNIQTPHSHNFLTQDGNTPAGIAAVATKQVLSYATIKHMSDVVSGVFGENYRFTINTVSGVTVSAKKVLFATGIKDLVPDIPGFAECWGISVVHCPYCHGYEYRGQPTGILMNGEMAFEMGKMIRNWTDRLTIFTNGESAINMEHQKQLELLKVEINEKQVYAVKHKDGYLSHLQFSDGSSQSLDALYARPPFAQHCPIPQARGCSVNEAGYLVVDEFQKTNIAGIYAAGDNTTMFRSVSAAVAAGTKAGAFINHELIAGK